MSDPAPRQFDNYRPKSQRPQSFYTKQAPQVKRSRLGLLLVMLFVALGYCIAQEVRSSFYQAKIMHHYAKQLDYKVKPQPAANVVYPQHGPFDQRYGYTQLPQMLSRLQQGQYHVLSQANFSAQLTQYAQSGFYPPYREKVQAGLTVLDCRDQAQFDFNYPRHVYRDPSEIPPAIATSLLFIENRELMKQTVYHNPVVDWPRLAKATVNQIAAKIGVSATKGGGSTLATQIEKFRHSPQGLTLSVQDKFIQLSSAMLRVYQAGEQTYQARRFIVQDYLNTVPLSSARGFGEVNGIGDGLHAWFGASFTEVNQLLNQPHTEQNSEARGLAFKQVLALMIAQRRPSYYLLQGQNELNQLADSHIRLLAQYGLIERPLIEAALASSLSFNTPQFSSEYFQLDSQLLVQNDNLPLNDKGITAVRIGAAQSLGTDLFHLDRYDLTLSSTLHANLQQKVSQHLAELSQLEQAKKAKILGRHLLTAEQLDKVIYSFALYESHQGANLVRVQTDNNPQPFDINQGSKLELGSTAKLRVITTYLDIIAELQQRFIDKTVADLTHVDVESGDAITRWVVDYLIATRDRNLSRMLDAAMQRTYSADPNERFFTGGSLHVFSNFDPKQDGLNPTLYQALQQSINIPFVRLMRDIVNYSRSYNHQGSLAQILHNDTDPRRDEYLAAFATREGGQYVSRFYRKYRKLAPEQRLNSFYSTLAEDSASLSAAFRYLQPQATAKQLKQFLQQRLDDQQFTDKQINRLYLTYGESKFNLADQGYLMRTHPLDVWVLKQMLLQPEIRLSELKQLSQEHLVAVYRWLFHTRNQNARDIRVKVMLEVDAFLSIHQRWSKWGYPFDYLVPSLASALGSSGDRPVALAELMGIIQNQGAKLPTVMIPQMHFAKTTPYEVSLQQTPAAPEQVLHPEVANTLKHALNLVVTQGSARRLTPVLQAQFAPDILVGGKTGTGDNRVVTKVEQGRKLESTAMNRTATFVFYLGDNLFGTITAFVPGEQADSFSFTSSLPLQVLNSLLPMLAPYVDIQSGVCETPAVAQNAPF
ncbi:transglycosylase domain-containing protein [Shewanella maritima]|uniref:transglycosylase domain-containing protein n=1 Tax=Shewanella maritima TaxID=2520507 RepID=UPI003735B2D2